MLNTIDIGFHQWPGDSVLALVRTGYKGPIVQRNRRKRTAQDCSARCGSIRVVELEALLNAHHCINNVTSVNDLSWYETFFEDATKKHDIPSSYAIYILLQISAERKVTELSLIKMNRSIVACFNRFLRLRQISVPIFLRH